MTSIDYRIAVRRRTVREAGARRRLGHLLIVIGFFVVVGLIVLLLQSPVMAVSDIEVAGADRADIGSVLERHNVSVGVPTISVRPADLAADVEAEPWVAKAQAVVTWPGTVTITVLEHVPVAWVKIGGDWHRTSATGAILEQSKPAPHGARVRLPGLSGSPGTSMEGERVTAALEFVALLHKELRRDAVVSRGGAGTLVARVDGHLVDLGSPTDMREKAAALEALIASGLVEGAAVSLVSPWRPAIRNPKRVVEG
ncbi:MAG: FtsQ-type POTRA domain-containing protein [bacterium]|nr:FtsQ-type POTRA domain-containing protein [bacterium]